MDPNNYEPIISYEMLHMMMTAFILTCLILPIVGYGGPRLWSWIKSLTILDSADRIELPEWDFGPELSHVRIIDMEVVPTTERPYDWAMEENDYRN
jgi:hypothetical protein